MTRLGASQRPELRLCTRSRTPYWDFASKGLGVRVSLALPCVFQGDVEPRTGRLPCMRVGRPLDGFCAVCPLVWQRTSGIKRRVVCTHCPRRSHGDPARPARLPTRVRSGPDRGYAPSLVPIWVDRSTLPA